MMKVEYFPEDHEYFLDGIKVNSVTQIIEIAHPTERHCSDDVWERAGAFGTNVHDMIALYDKDDLNIKELDPALLPYLTGWQRFLREKEFEIVGSEQIVSSKKYMYAGRLDRKGLYNGKLTLLDIKTGTRAKESLVKTELQTAAYAIAHDEGKKAKEKIKQRMALWLLKDGDYLAELHPNKSNYVEFLACITNVSTKRRMGK